MGRGLDGFFFSASAEVVPGGFWCSFQGPRRALASHRFPVALARGKHLFPFRTEKLSPSAPMVLGSQGPGRVGRRRFLSNPALAGRLFSRQSRWSGRSAGDQRPFCEPPVSRRLQRRVVDAIAV